MWKAKKRKKKKKTNQYFWEGLTWPVGISPCASCCWALREMQKRKESRYFHCGKWNRSDGKLLTHNNFCVLLKFVFFSVISFLQYCVFIVDSPAAAADHQTPHKELSLPSGGRGSVQSSENKAAYFSPFFGFADYKVGVSWGIGVVVVGGGWGGVGPL